MNAKQKNSLLAAAIVAGLLSLPMNWLTIRGAQVEGGFGMFFPGNLTVDVTGLSGYVTFLFKTPLWFIVCVAISAGVLQLMRYTQAFAVPKFAEWAVAVVGLVWITVPCPYWSFSQAARRRPASAGCWASSAPLGR